jgi:hypothetical protein
VYKEKYNLANEFKDLTCIKFSYKHWNKLRHNAFHKWYALMEFNRQFAFKRALYIDNDTFFNKNPDHLFNDYPDPEVFYGVRYNWLDLDIVQKQIGMKAPSLNSGQYIISKQVIQNLGVDFLNDLYKEYFKFQLLTQQYKPQDTHGVKWLGEELAATKVLENKNISIHEFLDKDVAIGVAKKTTTLSHYYSCNTVNTLPVEYWSEFTYNRNCNLSP